MATTLPNTGAIIPEMTEAPDQAVNNAAFTAIDAKIGTFGALQQSTAALDATKKLTISHGSTGFVWLMVVRGNSAAAFGVSILSGYGPGGAGRDKIIKLDIGENLPIVINETAFELTNNAEATATVIVTALLGPLPTGMTST